MKDKIKPMHKREHNYTFWKVIVIFKCQKI